MTLTAERLREVLDYNPATGVFRWRIDRGRMAPAGGAAGSVHVSGCRHIRIGGRSYKAHRLAWLYVTGVWPVADIDHINRKPDDNKAVNLREATRRQNMGNSKRYVSNKSGLKGVGYKADNPRKKPWAARINVAGKTRHIGYFMTAEAAHAAYLAAALKHFGEFANPGDAR